MARGSPELGAWVLAGYAPIGYEEERSNVPRAPGRRGGRPSGCRRCIPSLWLRLGANLKNRGWVSFKELYVVILKQFAKLEGLRGNKYKGRNRCRRRPDSAMSPTLRSYRVAKRAGKPQPRADRGHRGPDRERMRDQSWRWTRRRPSEMVCRTGRSRGSMHDRRTQPALRWIGFPPELRRGHRMKSSWITHDRPADWHSLESGRPRFDFDFRSFKLGS